MSTDQFCPECAVHMSLHPYQDETPDDCEAAQLKADALDTFGRSFFGGV